MAKRDVQGRYRGSSLGILWSLALPVLMLAVYSFVFSVIFSSRWPGSIEGDRLQFAMILFAGMIVFTIFSECVQRSPYLVVNQPNFVKKVVFPLEILAWTALAAALFHAAISFAILILVLAITHGALPLTAFWLPIVILPVLCLTLGLTWFFSALGVYVRDIGQILGVAVTALLFLSPLFYPSSALPQEFRWMAVVNPIAFSIEQARDVLIFGRMPRWPALGVYSVVAVAVMWCGFAWFQKTRRGFADVL